SNWADDFDKLESHHGYIQWLFPLTEHGVNDHAQTLTQQEIKIFKENVNLQKMLLRSYNLMLKFYGFKLESEETGKVSLLSNCNERFYNLCSSPHNFLRITRIIKCLSLLG
ncbi:hypothetical protein HELRODRAFT_144719, partial [Helobdella robusta]|uniref:Opioid growth factor receptor (OGFr) conserved domain-containing protein n=1 Tax=Helobdella robusta TaxID=6412 RepID=T1EJG0_HELRO